MKGSELANRIEYAASVVRQEFGGDLGALAVTLGTGWEKGVGNAFRSKANLPYDKLKIPGSELIVPGHEKSLQLGEINGRNAIIIGRVHANEDFTHPDLRQAMAVVLGAIDDCIDGLLITNGVGHLHGRVHRERGLIKSLAMTVILDIVGWAHRGRCKDRLEIGDIALTDDIKTGFVGSSTPLGAGDFVDFYHKGIHADGDAVFDLIRQVVTEVQGRCPLSQTRFIGGPQFEGLADKVEFRGQGDDVVGMSGIQEVLEATKRRIPFGQALLITNGPFNEHFHEGNQEVGKKYAWKTEGVVEGLAQRWPNREREASGAVTGN